MQALAACAAVEMPILLIMDMDFEQMPINHPLYDALGLGTAASARAYTAALMLADHLCTPNETLAAPLAARGYPVHVIPEGWNSANNLWDKPSPRRATLNLGWIGQPAQIEDMAMIRRVILRVVREFSHVRLVIVGDAEIYQLFDSLPESRRLFLPPVSMEDYPYLLGQVDILLAPMRNTPFNQGVSDRRLMEAGIRKIPWVASPIPSYSTWQESGLIASSLEEWHAALRQLILEPDLRAALGRAGRSKAETREMSLLGKEWLVLINRAIQAAAHKLKD